MNIEDLKRRKQEKGYTFDQLSGFPAFPLGRFRKFLPGRRNIPGTPRFRHLSGCWVRRILCHMWGRIPRRMWRRKPWHIMRSTEESGRGIYPEDYYALPDDQRVELIDGVFL